MQKTYSLLIFGVMLLTLVFSAIAISNNTIVYARERTGSMIAGTGTKPAPEPVDPSLTDPNLIPLKIEGAMPTKAAQKCADHDKTKYHGIWEGEKGCYYNHTHGDDPSKTIFADIAKGWEQEISYLWQTPNENDMKHEGYVYIYEEAKNGCELLDATSDQNTKCITHVLYLVHSMGTIAEVNARFHSFRAVARACDQNGQNCGFIQTGGWTDYGVLHCPYKKVHCPLPVDPKPLEKDNGILPDLVAIQQPPYRAVSPIDIFDAKRIASGKNIQFWNSFNKNAIVKAYYPENYNTTFGSSWSALDSWGAINPENPSESHFFCQDGSCTFNHSRFQLFVIRLSDVPAAPFSGYTNRQGQIDTNCKETGPTCIPYIVTGSYKGGTAGLQRQVGQGKPEKAPIHEYDVCFDTAGKLATCYKAGDTTAGWIKPNTMNMSNMSM